MTTACDALASALPVLTLKGSTLASRAAESLLRAAGLPELIAQDPGAFVSEASNLALDPARLALYRSRLAANRGSAPLFDTRARVRELEKAFIESLRRFDSGLPPASFAVPDGIIPA
jgi:predicted O-linked N-acetylglucosamine transferase (SPINDLY family)